MDESWHWKGTGGTGGTGSSVGNVERRETDELEYVVAESHATLRESMDDQQLMNLINLVKSNDESSPSKWTFAPVSKELSLDQGYFITVRAIQKLREVRRGPVLVGIGGPNGSGKSSLAERLAQILGGEVIDQSNYLKAGLNDDTYDVASIDFQLLCQHLQALLSGKSIDMPVFDWSEKKQSKFIPVKAPVSGVVLLKGIYALNSAVRPLLDISIAVVGGVHYNLLQRVTEDVRKSGKAMAGVMDSIFPLFRTQIEPDLAFAQIRISNEFVADSLREPFYILKTTKQVSATAIMEALGTDKQPRHRHDKYIDIYLKPPGNNVRMKDWIRMRQWGIRYFYTEGNQRIVDRNTIIRPRCEFEVGKTTLGGLLACNYHVAISFARESDIFETDEVVICIDTITDLQCKIFLQIRGKNRQVVYATAEALRLGGPWITQSYLEMVIDVKGVPRLPSPPLSSADLASVRSTTPPISLPEEDEGQIHAPVATRPAPLPVRTSARSSENEPWTRSPTYSDPIVGSWNLASLSDSIRLLSRGKEKHTLPGEQFLDNKSKPFGQSSGRRGTARMELVPKHEKVNFDRGLNLAVSAVQTLLKENGGPVIIGVGGPSGSGKSNFARKLADLVECYLLSLENYYKEDLVDDTNYDEFHTLDSSLLIQNIQDWKELRTARTPVFDFQRKKRVRFQEIQVSHENGVVVVEGIYALHPVLQQLMDIRVSVVGGVQSHLATRVLRDVERTGRYMGESEVIQTVFPMFREHIEPHLATAHLQIVNNFDPVHSHENTVFILKSSKEVAINAIAKVLNPKKTMRSFYGFTDTYFYMRGLDQNGPSSEGDFIRVRNCGNRFAILIREPIREGDFIVQSEVDFDVSIKTVGGLTKLGYHTAAIIEVNSTIHRDDQLLIEVDHLPKISRSFIQIKGSNKEAVAAAGKKLELQGTYTSLPYFEILQSTNKVAFAESVDAVHSPSAAKLQELVLRVTGQDDRSGSMGNFSPSGQHSPFATLSRLEARIRRLERNQSLSMAMHVAMLLLLCYQIYRQNVQSRH